MVTTLLGWLFFAGAIATLITFFVDKLDPRWLIPSVTFGVAAIIQLSHPAWQTIVAILGIGFGAFFSLIEKARELGIVVLITTVVATLSGMLFALPWWVGGGLGLLAAGIVVLLCWSVKYGVLTITAAAALLVGGNIEALNWFGTFPVLVYVGLGLAVIGVILLKRRMREFGIGVLVVALLVTILGAVGVGGGAQAAAVTNTPSDKMIDAITIRTVGYTCKTDSNGLIAPMTIKALEPLVGQGGSRLYADAESTPFTAETPAGMLDERKAENCSNPHLGSEAANFFANLKLGDVAVVDLNPWLKPFAGNPRDVVDEKADYYTLSEAEKAKMEGDSTAQQAAIDRNIEWKAVAEKLNTLIQAFKLDVEGAKAEQSYLNYHLVAGGQVADIPPVELNPQQENRPAILLYLIEKDGTCLVKMGFNVEDKRTEQFVCAPPPKPTTPGSPGTTTTPGQPGCTNCTTTTTTPGCKTCTTTTTPPTTTTGKRYTEAPGQGGAGDGGSGQYGGDGTTRHSITDGPSAPAAGDSHSGGGGSSPTDNPVPGGSATQQPSGPLVPGGQVTDPGGCAPAPGETTCD